MADALPTSNYYRALGGINIKASKYEMSTAQFLALYNLDFDVPNALQKRPGSTFATGDGTTGPISSVFEFVKLTGQSYVVAGSDTALFYITGSALTLLDTGWTNGQPADYLTFVNKMFVCNGQKWRAWDGSTMVNMGLPLSPVAMLGFSAMPSGLSFYLATGVKIAEEFGVNLNGNATTFMLVGGATHVIKGVSWMPRGVYVAYSTIRNDGYWGPVDFFKTARNIIVNKYNSNVDFFSGTTYFTNLIGFTVPAGTSAIALWVGVDTISRGNTTALVPNNGFQLLGDLGFADPVGGGIAADHYMSYTLQPNADTSKFWLFTTIPVASLFPVDMSSIGGGATFPILNGTTFNLVSFSALDLVAPPGRGWSGMTSDFFTTYIPKYQEINQNVLFASGFSSAPSEVKFSELGQPEAFFPESTFEVRTNDGDRVYMTKAHNNQIIIGKEHSFAKVIGDNADNYQLVELSTDFGCISNNSVLSKDQSLYWLDRKGILEFNGASWRIVSDAVEGIFRRMNLSAAKEKAVGIHHLYRNQLWWGIPIDGATQNNITVVYDYLVGAWTYFDGFNPASFGYIKGALSKPTVYRGDYSGFVHFMGESFYSDSGRGITCALFTRFENEGGENQTSIWRRLFLDVAQVTGVTGVINGRVFSNYDTSTVQATFTMYQDQFQSRAEMGVLGKGIAAQLSHYSASLPLLINGYGWAKRGLRNV